MHTRSRRAEGPRSGADAEPLVLPFADIDAGMVDLVGGKAANLGEATRAGLPVPPGFCLTTRAYALVAESAGLEPVLAELAALAGARADDPRARESLKGCAARAREALLAAAVPDEIVAAVTRAYAGLSDSGPAAVAVRSSATAEDLPFASFAGQQDTYLNVVGPDAVVDAMRRCWASLWTDRAVAYRHRGGIDHARVRLAVVVQAMVDAAVAGVMFTANPLTGRRRQAVIDASPGLGEAVVSGQVNPDHFMVDTATGQVLDRRLGDKRLLVRPAPDGGTERLQAPDGSAAACLDDDRLAALARLGAQVEDHYGAPQDTEWAIDGRGRVWLTQTRPVTTLYPLPEDAPPPGEDLRVYFCFSVAQGLYRPLTPMGISVARVIATGAARLFGVPVADPLAGPPAVKDPGGRLFFDVTPVLRSAVGRKIASFVLGMMEARSAEIFRRLFDDPGLGVAHPSGPVLRRFLRLALRYRMPVRAAEALIRPAAARARLRRIEGELRTAAAAPPDATARDRLALVERLLVSNVMPLLPRMAPAVVPAFALLGLVGKLLGDRVRGDELQTVLRGLPHNVTTEMNLRLWDIARAIGREDPARRLFLDTPPEELARMYQAGRLPAVAERGLADFLSAYGHRGVAEIDAGLPRWGEDPTHILGAFANYLRLDDPRLAPDAQFERSRGEAEEMVAELTRRGRERGRLRAGLIGFGLRRTRELAGLREYPKYCIVALLDRVREHLREVGAELAAAGRLEAADDIFFVDLREARDATCGRDLRDVARARRAAYDREMQRRHVPRVLLSDGTEPEAEARLRPGGAIAGRGSGDGPTAPGTPAQAGAGASAPAGAPAPALTGTPASPGTVTGRARVVLDPVGAHLEPGEILVAPSTDPGWTPLFLTAGGLVMEMGGANSHGAVVAREYGIPAVVGVPHATERVETGRLITVDGAAGTVSVDAQTLLPDAG